MLVHPFNDFYLGRHRCKIEVQIPELFQDARAATLHFLLLVQLEAEKELARREEEGRIREQDKTRRVAEILEHPRAWLE